MSAVYRADGSYHNDNKKTKVERKEQKCHCKCDCENCMKCVKKDNKIVEKFGFFDNCPYGQSKKWWGGCSW